MPKVIMTSLAVPLEAEAADILGSAGIEFEARNLTTEHELIAGATDADALIVVAEPISSEVLRALPRLQVVTRFGIGLDVVDIAAASAAGVWVSNVPDANYREVAVHTIALALNLSRRITTLDRAMHENGSAHLSLAFGTRRPDDQVFGLLGVGRIGRRVATMARAIGFQVKAFDPALTEESALEQGIDLVTFDELIATSDILSLHVPLTSVTANIIGEAEIARMPRGSILVNVSRGGLVDETALAAAIESGQIAGAGLDAFVGDSGPLDATNRLRSLERVILTPHSAHFSAESFAETKMKALHDVRSVLQGRPPTYAVNSPLAVNR
ncbi:C-terminal binding protein [Rhodococcus sp. 1R11]|uniref:C-terminal binding protein n=1 Tax=Rhodococcus sp. 1R11 TaxID=2559614 RepID=UPI00142FED35|nr:C-terminal binding protein [Rhodococcus sp. 1R11]